MLYDIDQIDQIQSSLGINVPRHEVTFSTECTFSSDFLFRHSDAAQTKDTEISFLEPDPDKAAEPYQNLILSKAHAFSDLTNIEVERLTTRSEVPITVVGQVVHEDEKLVYANVSLKMGKDQILLNLERIPEYSLFPGQILSVSGTSDEHVFYAQEIHTFPHNSMQTENSHAWTYDEPIKCAVIRGPFSNDGDLEFNPLERALKYIKNKKSSIAVAILIGPFVDANCSALESGQINSTKLKINDGLVKGLMEELKRYIEEKLKGILKVILIPSLQDIGTIDPLPQFFPFTSSNSSPQVITLPNPSSFKINDIEIGVIPYDVIRELVKETLHKYPRPVNKLEVALTQIIEQRSFCPVYPSDIPIDIGKIAELQMKCLPNILLVGTTMGLPDSSEIQGVKCVNAKPLMNKNNQLNATILTLFPPSRANRVAVNHINIP